MIELDAVTKHFGETRALEATTLTIASRETTALIGPSGCGKSTLIRLVSGLERPNSGRVLIDGRVLTEETIAEERRAMGYVIQEGGLFPHLTAEENVTLVARWLKTDATKMRARVHELRDMVRLPEKALTRYPAALSGGERQRVSLMRALMLDPKLLLLDEPMGALDPITRYELQEELKGIFARLNKTVLLVTHDLSEAAYLAHTIVLMRSGRVLQSGSFAALRDDPKEAYVRDFVQAQRAPLLRDAT